VGRAVLVCAVAYAVTAAWCAGSALAAESPTIPAGATTQVPLPASNILATCTPPGDFQPNPTVWSIIPTTVKVTGLVTGMPAAGSFVSVTVPRDAPYRSIFIGWTGNTACVSFNGYFTITVGPTIATKSNASICATKKNVLYGQDAKGRAWWRKVEVEARRRANVAAEWGEFFDLFTWLSKLPGLNDPELKAALEVLNVADAGVAGIKLAVDKAEKEFASATAGMDKVKATQSAVTRQINQLTIRPGRNGPRPLNPAERAKLAQLKRQLAVLRAEQKAAQQTLNAARAGLSAANAQLKSKVMDPFVDKLLGSSKPALKALGRALAVLNLGQAGAATGIVGFSALAAYAKHASKPPKGCST
jgi:hypothetical protein